MEPLANEILNAEKLAGDLDQRALDFVDIDKGLRSQADVLLGVGHLIAEHLSERADLREALRRIVRNTGRIVCNKMPEPQQAKSDKEAASPKEGKSKKEKATAESDGASAEKADANATAPDSRETPTSSDAAVSAEATPDPQAGSEASPSQEASPEAPADSEAKASEASAASESTASESAEPESMVTPESETGTATESTDETEPAQATADATSQPAVPADAGESDSAEAGGAPPEGTPPSTAETSEPTAESEEARKQAEKREKEEKRKQLRAERKKRKDEAKKRKRKQRENAYKDYFKFSESIGKLPPHRVLAINRGERDRVLRVKLEADQESMRQEAEKLAIPAGHPHAEFLRGCLKDTLTRLVFPALEREVRRELTEKAEDHAVTVFARNLRHLLLTPPVSGQRVLAVDPGFRSGCKLAALDEFGIVHGHGAIFLVGPEERKQRSRARLAEMIKLHKITVVAIGNGTACRETENLVADVLANELKDEDVSYVIVNEAGASVYSTSPVGREELGQFEAAQRSAVSIGRRLLDPLSELVKINPANIGVGMYQHDMKAKHLQDSLDAVVESCVNYVGVDLNTASPSLLRYVSGLNQLTARRLFEHRQQKGPFKSRDDIKEVPGIGEATFVQAAGFLKIAGGENPLDATWIHPESYDAAKQVLQKLDFSVESLAARVSSQAKPAPFAAGLDVPSSADEKQQDDTDATASDGQAKSEAPAAESEGESKPEATEATTADPAAVTETSSDLESAAETATEASATGSTSDQPDDAEATAPTTDSPEEDASAKSDTLVEDATESKSPIEAPPEETTSSTSQLESQPEEAEQAAVPPKVDELSQKAASVDVASLANELQIGELLCRDILASLSRPGRDPRDDLPPPIFRTEILKLEDLKEGMHLKGTVLNVVDFGAFVDIGLHDTGLVHISRLANRYIKDPHEVVGVGDIIDIWVMAVDKERRRVQLTAIKPGTEQPTGKRPPRRERTEKGSRPPRGDRKEQGQKSSQKQGERKRRDRRDDKRGRRPAERRPSKPFVLESKKEPKKKLTKAKKEGRKPLQTFGELAQFLTQSDETPEETSPPEKPEAKTEPPPSKAESPESTSANGPDAKEQSESSIAQNSEQQE